MTTQKLDFDGHDAAGLDVNQFLLIKLKQACKEIDLINYKREKYQEAIGNAFRSIYERLSNLEQQESQNNLLLTVVDNQLNKMLDKLDKLEGIISNGTKT